MQQKQHTTERTTSRHMATRRPFGQPSTPTRVHSRIFLRKTPHGSRVWIQQIEFSRREHEIILGSFPTLSLAEARKIAARNREIVDMGGDPIAKRRTAYVMLLREELDRLSNRVGRDTGRSPLEAKYFGSNAEPVELKATHEGGEEASADEAALALQPTRFGLRNKVQKLFHRALRSVKDPADQFAETEVTDAAIQKEALLVAPRRSDIDEKLLRQEVQAGARQLSSVCNADVMAGLRLKAGEVGPNVDELVRVMLLNAPVQKEGIAKSEELLSQVSQCGAAQLDAACARALELNTYSLSAVTSFLKETPKAPCQDTAPKSSTIAHDNIRGANYFN